MTEVKKERKWSYPKINNTRKYLPPFILGSMSFVAALLLPCGMLSVLRKDHLTKTMVLRMCFLGLCCNLTRNITSMRLGDNLLTLGRCSEVGRLKLTRIPCIQLLPIAVGQILPPTWTETESIIFSSSKFQSFG